MALDRQRPAGGQRTRSPRCADAASTSERHHHRRGDRAEPEFHVGRRSYHPARRRCPETLQSSFLERPSVALCSVSAGDGRYFGSTNAWKTRIPSSRGSAPPGANVLSTSRTSSAMSPGPSWAAVIGKVTSVLSFDVGREACRWPDRRSRTVTCCGGVNRSTRAVVLEVERRVLLRIPERDRRGLLRPLPLDVAGSRRRLPPGASRPCRSGRCSRTAAAAGTSRPRYSVAATSSRAQRQPLARRRVVEAEPDDRLADVRVVRDEDRPRVFDRLPRLPLRRRRRRQVIVGPHLLAVGSRTWTKTQ